MHCEAQFCSNPVDDLYCCDACNGPRYCSAECKSNDKFHQYSCGLSQLSLNEFEFLEGSEELDTVGSLCVHSPTNRQVLLRRLSKEWLETNLLTESVMTTIRLHRSVFHPHVLRLYSVTEDEASLYTVLEHAPNGSLALYSQHRGPLNEELAWKFFTETCVGLHCLVRSGIEAVDLTPERILLDGSHRVKLQSSPQISQSFSQDLGKLLFTLLHGSPPQSASAEIRPEVSLEARNLLEILLSSTSADLNEILLHPWVTLHAPEIEYKGGQELYHTTLGKGYITDIEGILCSMRFESGELTLPVSDLPWSADVRMPRASLKVKEESSLELSAKQCRSSLETFQSSEEMMKSSCQADGLFGCGLLTDNEMKEISQRRALRNHLIIHDEAPLKLAGKPETSVSRPQQRRTKSPDLSENALRARELELQQLTSNLETNQHLPRHSMPVVVRPSPGFWERLFGCSNR